MQEVAFKKRFSLASGSLVALVLSLAFLRIVHVQLLWSDEDYHLAAALDILRNKVPYRDFWYDKPPLDAIFYLLIGAHSGWALRLLDGAYVCVAARFAFLLARELWGEVEGGLAALLLPFFLAFYLPAGVIPFAADALLIVPHLAAILCAQRRAFSWAGAWAGIGLLVNIKSVFVLAACAAWAGADLAWLAGGFLIPVALGSGVLAYLGAWPGCVEQVWRWGLQYARSYPSSHVFREGAHRVADWAGFHSALVIGSVIGWKPNARLLVWITLSFLSVCVGGRFVPRYFLQLLPPLSIVGAHGIVLAWRRYGTRAFLGCALLLAIPLVRFGPRYLELAIDPQPHWADVSLDEDSRRVASYISLRKSDHDTLFVWGYRPDIYVYTRLIPADLFWDSQPLTGVPADRHLSATTPVYSSQAEMNRQALVRSRPTFIVDGLGLLNPNLAPQNYPEIRAWLQNYEQVAKTPLSVLYRRR